MLKNCFMGQSFVRPSLVRNMHHCMSRTALAQGLLEPEVEKALDIDYFV